MWSFFSRDPAKGFPYEVLEKADGFESDQSIWSLHYGKQKSNGNPVSVFMFDVTSNSETAKQTAQASTKRLKTLKHPNILTFLDSLETDKCIYVVTEPVKPLAAHLKEIDSETSELAISWGLHQIVKGLSFLLNSVNVIHNNVCMSSMFADSSGEWKLGGTDYMYPASGEGSNLPPIKTPPALERYDPPEKSAPSGRKKKSNKWSSDMWGLGCLIWEVFNGQLPRTSSLKVIGKIPKSLVQNYCELVSANPASRPSPDKFLEGCFAPNAFFNNHFVQANLFLSEIQIKEAHEQSVFFTDLTGHLDEFPKIYSKNKILPQLLNAFQYGNGGPTVLPPLFKLGSYLDADEYQAQIVPCVVKLFSSTDRATRIHLLRQLHLFVEHLQPAVVNTQVFPNMVSGFMDTNPAIREQTVKGMLLLAPKLNDNNLNNELMKYFARLQSRDDQGPIRTNTTVCLGKMTQYLNPSTRQKVISSAFSRAMKDPFPAARIAGVLATCNNVQYFTTKDCAFKALPALSAMTVDPDKPVRDNAFKTIKIFLDKLQNASDDPEQATRMDEAANTASTATGASGWAGWMSTGVTTFTSKLYKQNQTLPGQASSSKSPDQSNQPKQPTSASRKTPDPVQHPPQDKDQEQDTEEDNGWEDDDDWGGLEKSAISEDDEEDPGLPGGADGGWDNSGWGDEKEKSAEDQESTQDDGWDQDWKDDGFTDKGKEEGSSLAPASSYRWSQSDKANEDEFFNEFSAKPKKGGLGQRAKQSAKPKPAQTRNIKKKPDPSPAPSSDNFGWDNDDGWNNDSWGADDTNQGLSKAEQLKREREEKRRQRQKQLEGKKAAAGKSGPKKLGARKCD